MEHEPPMHARAERVSEAEYLALENKAETKSEWYDGQMVAMTGASIVHNMITAELLWLIRGQLGDGCDVLANDQRLLVDETGLYTYPDLMVVCGPLDLHPDDRHTVRNPSVVIEVLSPSTEAYDRGAKAAHYRRIPSLQAYVFVSQHTHLIECYARRAEGWLLTAVEAGALRIDPPGITLDVDAVYARADRRRAELDA